MMKLLPLVAGWLTASLLLLQPVIAAPTLWQLQNPLTAAKAPSIFAPTHAGHQRQILQQGQLLTPDISALDQLSSQDLILLPLPESTVEAVVKEIQRHSAHSYSIIATIQQGKEQLPVVITRGPKGFFARIVTAEQTYLIRGDIRQSRLIVEHALSDRLDFNLPDALVPPPPSVQQPPLASGQQTTTRTQQTALPYNTIPQHAANQHATNQPLMATSKLQFPELTDPRLAIVDVLMIYSPEAAAEYNGDISTRLNHLIAVTNKIYQDSGVLIQIQPVAMKEVPLVATESYAQLYEITDKKHAFTELDQWKYETGADIVALFTPSTATFVCGIAWYGVSSDTEAQFNFSADYLISLTHTSCSDYVLAHEAGHNMGLAHSEKQGETGSSFPFARGYGIENSFATVMAYESVFQAPKVYQFSNPLLQCAGSACGIERHDPHGADAAYALNAIRFGLANVSAPVDLQLFEQAISQISDPALKSCMQEVRAIWPQYKYAGQLTSFGNYNTGANCTAFNSIVSLQGLEQFRGITQVSLSAADINDFSPLGQLNRLATLTLSGSGFDILNTAWFSTLDELHTLNIYNYLLSDLSTISSRPKLTSLELVNILVDNFAPLQQLTSLKRLRLQPWLTSADRLAKADWLSSLPQLNSLHLTQTELSKTTMMQGLTQLQQLVLESSQPLNLAGLRHLPSLTGLYLQGSHALDCASAYQTWRTLPQIRTLNLPGHCKTDDLIAPTFGQLPELVIEATARNTPYTPTPPIARDNSDGDITATTDQVGPYPIGEQQIWWTARDFNGNSSTEIQVLRVQDTTAPTITGPDHATTTTYDPNGVHRYDIKFHTFIDSYQANDRVDGLLPLNYSEQEYWSFGVHRIPLTATDHSNNMVSRSVLFVVNYFYGPKITAPDTLTLPAPGPAGLAASDSRVQQFIAQVRAIEFYTNQPLAITADYPAQLLPGKNLLVFSATDDQGYKNSLIAEIILTDQQAPTLTVPARLKLSAGSGGIANTDPRILQFLQSARASDNFDPPSDSQVVINYNLPARFMPGVTAVLFTATDASGNKVSAEGYVEVTLTKRQSRLLQLLLLAPKQ